MAVDYSRMFTFWVVALVVSQTWSGHSQGHLEAEAASAPISSILDFVESERGISRSRSSSFSNDESLVEPDAHTGTDVGTDTDADAATIDDVDASSASRGGRAHAYTHTHARAQVAGPRLISHVPTQNHFGAGHGSAYSPLTPGHKDVETLGSTDPNTNSINAYPIQLPSSHPVVVNLDHSQKVPASGALVGYPVVIQIPDQHQPIAVYRGQFPAFIERILQRIQNRYSVYNPPDYFENRPRPGPDVEAETEETPEVPCSEPEIELQPPSPPPCIEGVEGEGRNITAEGYAYAPPCSSTTTTTTTTEEPTVSLNQTQEGIYVYEAPKEPNTTIAVFNGTIILINCTDLHDPETSSATPSTTKLTTTTPYIYATPSTTPKTITTTTTTTEAPHILDGYQYVPPGAPHEAELFFFPSNSPPPSVYLPPSSTAPPIIYLPPSTTTTPPPPPNFYLPPSTTTPPPPPPDIYIPPPSTSPPSLPPHFYVPPSSTPPPPPPPHIYLPPTYAPPPSHIYHSPSSTHPPPPPNTYLPPKPTTISTPAPSYLPPESTTTSTPGPSYLPPDPAPIYLPPEAPAPGQSSTTEEPLVAYVISSTARQPVGSAQPVNTHVSVNINGFQYSKPVTPLLPFPHRLIQLKKAFLAKLLHLH